MHRLWICPCLQADRERLVPAWLRSEVALARRADGSYAPGDLLLYTRGLAPSPAPALPAAEDEESFQWVVRPQDGVASSVPSAVHAFEAWRTGHPPDALPEFKGYVDGSLLDGDWQYAGLCARRGWAFAVMDSDGRVAAAAKGRPPAWAHGIHGAELWGLLQACRATVPDLPLRVDCQAVHVGSQRGLAWAAAPMRVLARAWMPLADILDGCIGRVAWMPAHLSSDAAGSRRLSNGEVLTAGDITGNAYVDALAKSVAQEQRLTDAERRRIRNLFIRVEAVAKWIGQATYLANHFPRPDGDLAPGSLRDSEGVPKHKRRSAPSAGAPSGTRLPPSERPRGDLSACARWCAVRDRVAAREAQRARTLL